jgi:glycosyltransferase involved in cell wall biosynthesis
MKKIRLAHIQLLPELWGAQKVMLDILSGLDRNKYEIFVISCSPGPLIEKLHELKIEHIAVNSMHRSISLWDFKAFLDLILLFRKYKFDIVHTHSSKPGFLGRIAARLAGVKKVIHTSHGYPFNQMQSFPVRTFYKICEMYAGFFCDKMVFVNHYHRKLAIRQKLISPAKAITIYNGVELPELTSQKVNEDRFLIGSTLRFWDSKNPLIMIKAAIEVCRKKSKIDFLFLGDGELLAECRQMVISAGLESRISLPGLKRNIYDCLFKMDAFILFSKWEGLPLSILEAMSIGLPIIASDIPAHRELLSNGSGILVALNQVDKLIGILVSLPSRKDELAAWSKASRRFVEEKCSLSEFRAEYRKIYEV